MNEQLRVSTAQERAKSKAQMVMDFLSASSGLAIDYMQLSADNDDKYARALVEIHKKDEKKSPTKRKAISSRRRNLASLSEKMLIDGDVETLDAQVECIAPSGEIEISPLEALSVHYKLWLRKDQEDDRAQLPKLVGTENDKTVLMAFEAKPFEHDAKADLKNPVAAKVRSRR